MRQLRGSKRHVRHASPQSRDTCPLLLLPSRLKSSVPSCTVVREEESGVVAYAIAAVEPRGNMETRRTLTSTKGALNAPSCSAAKQMTSSVLSVGIIDHLT